MAHTVWVGVADPCTTADGDMSEKNNEIYVFVHSLMDTTCVYIVPGTCSAALYMQCSTVHVVQHCTCSAALYMQCSTIHVVQHYTYRPVCRNPARRVP